jgi:hypothetical protein
MATVKFSGALRDNIIRNAEQLFTSKIEAAVKEYDNSWGEKIIDRAYTPFMQDVNKLPRNWFHWTDEATSSMVAGVKLDSAIKFKFSESKPVPVQHLNTSGHAPISFNRDAYYISNMNTDDDPIFEDIKTEVLAYKNKITLIKEKRDKFVSGVRELIYAHSTLAPALAVWKPLWDLLPDETKTRHMEKVERVKAEKAELAANLDALTATFVASKIGG